MTAFHMGHTPQPTSARGAEGHREPPQDGSRLLPLSFGQSNH